MATTFRPCEPDQMLLLAPDVREWLSEGHFAHHVSDLVDGLDLTAFYAPYEGDGRRIDRIVQGHYSARLHCARLVLPPRAARRAAQGDTRLVSEPAGGSSTPATGATASAALTPPAAA